MASALDTHRYESSAGELSSPPSVSLSEPESSSRHTESCRVRNSAVFAMDQGEIVGSSNQRQPSAAQTQSRQIAFQEYQQPSPGAVTGNGTGNSVGAGRSQSQKRFEFIDGQWVQLTAAGVPRKKPGRKPGTVAKPKTAPDGAPEPPKPRKPRKPRDPNAPPIQRKRKIAASDVDTDGDGQQLAIASASSSQMATTKVTLASTPPQHQDQNNQQQQRQRHELQPSTERHHRTSPKMFKREGYPGSMQSILNADPPTLASATTSTAAKTVTVRSSGLSYDPIRGNYDPVRETITAHSTGQFSSTSGSLRGLTQLTHRSPSIASLLEPRAPNVTSPTQSHSQGHRVSSAQSRLEAKDPSSVPHSPSYRPASHATPIPRQAAQDTKESGPDAKTESPLPPLPGPRSVVNHARFTTIANGPVRKNEKTHTGVSTSRTDNLDDVAQESESRSILDFGKARPGEELSAPTIILKIPIKNGETNKYVNFTRLAEERYGWDALHPRLAANRDRKARIAAAAASLEKVDSGRESGDEMSVDLSDGEGSNPENGGTSGPDAQAKPKKKRNFKEDQYDVDDDFVDDSEMLWEAQAAASRDGFFVYSGPLVPEIERPPAGHGDPPKRGRGSRGGRGGRGAARGGATSRGGGPGSRGGTVGRKPRVTKSEKLQREREKADRETTVQLSKTPTNVYARQPTTPSFTVSEIGA